MIHLDIDPFLYYIVGLSPELSWDSRRIFPPGTVFPGIANIFSRPDIPDKGNPMLLPCILVV